MLKLRPFKKKSTASFFDKDNSGSLGQRSARGGMIIISSNVMKIVIQLVSTAALSRILDPSDFGLVAMALTVTGFISLFTDLGLSSATIQREHIDQEIISSLFFVNIIVGFGLFLLATIISPFVGHMFHDSRVMVIIICLACSIPIAAAGSQHAALLARSMCWGPIQLAGIVSQLIGLVMAVLYALNCEPGYFAIVIQAVAGSVTSTVLLWLLSGWRPSLTLALDRARSAISFGAYISGFNFINYLHDQFDNFLLGWKYGSVELGYYSRAYSLLQMPLNTINNAVSQAAIPALSRLAAQPEDWRRAFLHLLTGCAFMSMGICCILFVIAPPLIDILLGPGWTPVATLFRYLIVASIFGSATNVCGYAFISLGKSREFFRWGLFASPIFALSYVIGLPWAAVGVAIAYSISMAILSPIYLAYTARVAGFSFIAAGARVLPFIVASGATCFTIVLVTRDLAGWPHVWQMLLSATLAGTMYFALSVACLLTFPIYRQFRQFFAKNILKRAP